MSNQESNSKPLLAADFSTNTISDHHNGFHEQQLRYDDHNHALLLRQQNQQSPFSQNHQNLEDALSRLSLMPQNQNHHTPMNLGGEASNIFSMDERFKGYPFAPNHSSDVGLIQQQQESNNKGYPFARTHSSDVGLMLQQQDSNNNIGFQTLPWFNTNNEYVSSSTVPMVPSSQSYGINRLRSSLIASAYQREYQRLLSMSQLSGNNQFLGFRGRSYGYHRDHDVMLNPLIGNNRRNNNVLGQNLNNNRRQQQPPLMSHRSVYDLRGRILFLAKDQCGCRVLQDAMDAVTTKEEVSIVFGELIDNVVELMPNPYGNYVFQRLVEICSVEQITRIVLIVTQNAFQLVNLCLHTHGTRAVQRLLEYITNEEQRSRIMSTLSPNAVVLSKDTNGLHVIEHCVKKFENEDTTDLMDVVANNCFELATDKSGCCVMQLCVDHAKGEVKEKLLAEIIVNAPLLSEDCYGNYVVQHLIGKQEPRLTESLMGQLEGRFVSISCNKYGSNVVEKLFQESGEHYSRRIILELLHHPDFSMLLVDPYGNYVISSAVSVSKGAIRKAILELVRLNYPIMRTDHYGKKLLSRLRGAMSHVLHV